MRHAKDWVRKAASSCAEGGLGGPEAGTGCRRHPLPIAGIIHVLDDSKLHGKLLLLHVAMQALEAEVGSAVNGAVDAGLGSLEAASGAPSEEQVRATHR